MNIANKEVTLKSNGTNQYSITKSISLTNQLLDIWNSNTVSLSKIIMNGGKIVNNNASSTGGDIYARKDYNASVTAYLKGGVLSNNIALTGPNTYTVNGAQIIYQR